MITNRTVKGILEDFCKQYSINKEEDKAFEYLANYIILSGFEFSGQIDIDLLQNIDVDPNGGTFGLDSIQFFVNDNLVLSKEDIDIYIKSNSLKVDIVFIQAKTSSKIDTGEILKTITAVRKFLKDGTKNENESLRNAYSIYETLFDFKCSRHFDSKSPKVSIFFVTTSDNVDDNIQKFCDEEARELLSGLEDIRDFNIKVIGADYIISKYKESVNTVSAEFNFKSKIELDEIQGINTAYIGYINGDELLKLLQDSQGDIRKWIFYDNVRDFQGMENPVNIEIDSTIKSEEMRDKFLLFNNGITVVTKSIKPLGGNNFTIKDFQIVNGCQTCNVIFNNIDFAHQIRIPIKIIASSDENIICSIVKANNRQTPVSNEQFLTLETFHRRLQDLYAEYAKEMPLKLFYERRVGEARNDESWHGYKIVTLHAIIRGITATVFKDAYIVYNNNPTNILRNRRDKLFQDGHVLEAYFVGNYIIALINDMQARGKIEVFANSKFYIAMVTFIILSNTFKDINLSSREARRLMAEVIKKLKSEKIYTTIVNASKFIRNIYHEYSKSHKIEYGFRDKSFNSMILDSLMGICRK